MKYLKTFEGLFSFLKNKKLLKYLVTYNVTNFKAKKEDWEQGKYSKKITSENYEYLINSNSEQMAKDEFIDLWNKEVETFEPKPQLNVLSVRLIDDKETIGSFKNKIKIMNHIKTFESFINESKMLYNASMVKPGDNVYYKGELRRVHSYSTNVHGKFIILSKDNEGESIPGEKVPFNELSIESK
jgi:hypothetical protein